MANRFNQNIQGRFVILKEQVESGTTTGPLTRLVKVVGGQGAFIGNAGKETDCVFVSNPVRSGPNAKCIVDGTTDFERFATESEITAGQMEG